MLIYTREERLARKQEYNRIYYRLHKEESKHRSKERALKNPARIKARFKEWYYGRAGRVYKAKYAARLREMYATDPEYRKRKGEWDAKSYRTNLAKRLKYSREYSRKYRTENKETVKKSAEKYRISNRKLIAFKARVRDCMSRHPYFGA